METNVLLSVGSDHDLMKTRSLVLLKAGYAVRESSSTQDAVAVFSGGDFDLVIICHTISEPERLSLIAAIRAESPSAKIVIVRRDGEASAKLADESVHSLDGPDVLLSAIARSLNHAVKS